jgi:ubiquinone biosynthesis protein
MVERGRCAGTLAPQHLLICDSLLRLRRFRLYRIVSVALVIFVVAWRYWWLQRRKRATQAQWDRAHAKTGAAIYGLATRLGGAFVKLGQVLGARADVLPAAFVAPLRGLHDRVPARPLAKLRDHVERELGKPIDDVFSHVEPTALAAASLAQVHRATLKTGGDVVIKIQYPEARRLFPIDLGSLRRAVRVARWLNRGLDLRVLVDELAEFVVLELDFEREAASTARIRANLAGDPTVVVPAVHFATGKLLVLEFLSGTPLSAAERLREHGVDLRDIARRVAQLYATMIFEHGFFHGDPHPGNILVLDDGRLGLLDFGLAKELPAGFGASAAQMITSAMTGNTAGALTAARAVGFVVPDELAPELGALVRTLLGDYKHAGQLLQNVRRGRLEIPSHFTLIMRVLVILSGVSHTLVPNERMIGGVLAAALAAAIARSNDPDHNTAVREAARPVSLG